MTSVSTVIPPVGHFNLSLLTNSGPIVQVTADYKQKVLENYLERKRNRPERHAIRNLLGLLAFARGDKESALRYFEKILSDDEDPWNLNALANRDHVKRQTSTATEYVTSGVGIAAATLDFAPDLSTEPGKKRQARRYAEQAFAFMFELYDETVTYERYSKALDLDNEAMKLAGNLVDHTEKEDWQFGIGLASFKILSILHNKGKKSEATSALKTAVQSFGAIVDSSSADTAIRSQAWMQLALTFNKGSRLSRGLQNIPRILEGYVDNPEACLKKALELSPDDPFQKARILARLAGFRNRAGRFEEAMGMLAESIRLDPTNVNFHAYSTRAALSVKRYRKSLNNNPANPGLIDLITQAKTDLEFILQHHVSPWDFEALAEVYYHLARSTSGDESTGYITKALETCQQSEECQDGSQRSDLHKLRGKVLCCMGEHQQAMESFQRGVECEKNTGWKSGNEALLAKERGHVQRGTAGN